MSRPKIGPTSQAFADIGVRSVSGIDPNRSSPPFDSSRETPSVRVSLRVMALAFGAGDLQARDPAQQQLVQDHAHHEHHHPRDKGGDDRSGVRS